MAAGCPTLSRVGSAWGRFTFGLSTRGGPFAVDDLTATAEAVDQPLGWVLWYEEFTAAPPSSAVDAVLALGAQPMITWEPWRWDGRPAPTMQMIDSGMYDGQLRRWAHAMDEHAGPVYLRFAHEFNGHWYPWAATSVAPAAYISVWRRIHRIFAEQGAAVRWVWSPDAGVTAGPLEQWYPGDDVVDLVGVDGYNWGTSQEWSRWVEPDALFDAALDEIASFAGPPVVLTEVGCAEAGGSKPNWIVSLCEFLAERGDVTGLIWFDHDKETDWRIASSAASTAAMAQGLAGIGVERTWGAVV